MQGSQTKIPLEKRLFHELHRKNIRSPSIKEFNECWAFSNTVRSHFKRGDFDVVIDVAGGQGCLAALFLILASAKRAVVIDPAEVGQNSVDKAWHGFYEGKDLIYRHECLRTALGDELDKTLNEMGVPPSRILVVACHACQHLSDETLEIVCNYGVHAAVMPCCQKDLDGSSWKALGKRLGINFASLMDILMAGKVMAWNTGKEAGVSYQVRMKAIDEKITPQNRIILCKALTLNNSISPANQAKILAHEKLKRAYSRAHSHPKKTKGLSYPFTFSSKDFCVKNFVIGLTAGIVLSNLPLLRHRG